MCLKMVKDSLMCSFLLPASWQSSYDLQYCFQLYHQQQSGRKQKPPKVTLKTFSGPASEEIPATPVSVSFSLHFGLHMETIYPLGRKQNIQQRTVS